MMNKRGDVTSMIFIIIFLFSIGTTWFLISHFNNELYHELDRNLNQTNLNTSETSHVLSRTIDVNNSAWDYGFFAVFMGSLIAIGITGWMVRISPVFYWIYGIMSMLFLGLAVILSNIWQDISSDPEFAVTIVKFPITNAILGSYYPAIITAMIIFMMIIMFGKSPKSTDTFQ